MIYVCGELTGSYELKKTNIRNQGDIKVIEKEGEIITWPLQVNEIYVQAESGNNNIQISVI